MSPEEKLVPPATGAGFEPCEECGAPLDPQQRYCVNCAARRGNGANPSSRYFAAMSKKARRPPARAQKAGGGSRAAAVGFFALLPIAVAIGVVVGRSGSGGGDEEALLKALKSQEAAVASAPTTTSTPTEANPKAKKAKAESKAQKKIDKEGGKVLANTKNGEVHEVTNFHPTKEKEAEDTKLVEENPEQTGENYIKAQQNLPDVTVVGGSGETSAPAGGAEP
jgi:hypothetical protein